jgi:hypothetical protein
MDLNDVLALEQDELALRRNKAQLKRSDGTAASRDYRSDDVNDAIGLAVSGGGVRSAAFSLGVIQALYERGFLRFCDYLSTVSGGGYVGGFLTSLAVHNHTDLTWTKRPDSGPNQQPAAPATITPPAGQNGSAGAPGTPPADQAAPQPPAAAQPIRRAADEIAEKITIESDAQRRPPHYVRRLILGSSYLDRPLLFFSHWLPGFLQNNIIAISSLLTVCALGAWLFRTLDTVGAQRVLRALGFSDDVSRAFFPTVVVFTIWALVLFYRSLRALFKDRVGASSVAPLLTLLLLITALASAVSLIGVGDVNVSLLAERLHIPVNSDFIVWLQSMAHWILYTVLAVAIIPYLSPGALVKSGGPNAPVQHRLFFRFMTHALLWGLPLVVFGLLASENISQYNQKRDDRYLLSNQTVKDWPDLVRALDYEPASGVAQGDGKQEVFECNRNLWARLQGKKFGLTPGSLQGFDPAGADLARMGHLANPTTGRTAAELTRQVAREDDLRGEIARRTAWSVRLGSAVMWVFGARDNNQFEQILDNEWQFQQDRELAVALLNDQLLRTDFTQVFRPLAEDLQAQQRPLKAPAEFRGDPAALLDAYENALRTSAEVEENEHLRQHVERVRHLHVLAAVIDHQLSVAPDRSQWSADLYPVRDRVRHELSVLKSPLEKVAGRDEVTEAAMAARLQSLEKANVQLLRAFYGPDQLHSYDDIFARVVVDADQNFRLLLFAVSLGVFLIAGMCIDLNSTSLHRFYRDRLASVWLVGARHDVPRLVDLKTSAKGAPYLLVNCALSFLRPGAENRETTASFLFSHKACGSNLLGFAESTSYEGGQFDLADAMAISGAAVTPTVTGNLAVRALMWLMNGRLGRWMANPSVRALLDQPTSYRRLWKRPQALHLLLSWLLVPEQKRDFHFVSDGGLHENLGIEPLIERRCRLIVAIDAGSDPDGKFEDLVKLLLRLRLHHGVEIEALSENSPLDRRTPADVLARSPLGRMLSRGADGKPTPDGSCQSHFVLVKVRYLDQDEPGWLVYVRPGFDGDESEALRRYRTQNASFPNDTTDDQFFTFARFEAYRLLGEHIGQSLCAQLVPNLAQINSIPKLLDRIKRHAASAEVVSETTLTTAALPSVPIPQAAPVTLDPRSLIVVDALTSPVGQTSRVLPPFDVTPAAKDQSGSPPRPGESSGGNGPGSATADGAPGENPLAAANGSAAIGAAPHNGSAAGGNTGPAPGKPTATAPTPPPAAANDRQASQRAQDCDRLLREIDSLVDRIVARGPDKPDRSALTRLDRAFERLEKLDWPLAMRELRRINRRLFRMVGHQLHRTPRRERIRKGK